MSDATAGQQTTRFDREKANEVLQNAHLSVEGVLDALAECVRPVEGVTLTREEARDAAEALDIAQESIDDYADQFSDVDARLDEGKTRAAAARMRALASRLEASH